MKFLAGFSLHTFSSWLDFIAVLSITSFYYKGDAWLISVVAIANLLPPVIFSKQISILTTAMKSSHTLASVSIAKSIVYLFLYTNDNIFLFVVLISIKSFFCGLIYPTYNKLLVLFFKENQSQVVGKMSLINNLSKILAPLIGAHFGQIFSLETVFIVCCCISFLAIPFSFLGKAPYEAPLIGKYSKNETTDTRLVTLVRQHFVLTMSVYFLIVFMINNMLALIVREAGGDESLFSIMISAGAVGNVLGSILFVKLNSELMKGFTVFEVSKYIVYLSLLLMGIFIIYDSLNEYVCFLMFFMGMFSTLFLANFQTILVKKYEANIMEISIKIQSLQNVIMIIAPIMGSTIVSMFGYVYLFLIASIIGFVFSILISLIKRLTPNVKLSKFTR